MVAAGNHDEGLDGTAVVAAAGEPFEGVHEDVDALVAVLVASADADEDGVGGHLVAGHRTGDIHEAFARGVMEPVVIGVRGGSEAVLEAVRRHDVDGAAMELGALPGGDVGNGREDVGVAGRGLLEGVAGDVAETAGHLVAVIGGEIVVQGQVVAGDAAAHHGRMGREDRRDGDAALAEVENTGAGLPLMELGDDLVGLAQVVVPEAFDHAAGDIAEQGGLLVIPVAADRVDTVVLPELGEDVVALRQQVLVVHQDGDGRAGDVPAADAQAQAAPGGHLLPSLVEVGVFEEIRVAGTVHPHIRTDQDVVATELGLEMEGFGGDDGVDAADLVANLPADFKQIIGSGQFFLCSHITSSSQRPSSRGPSSREPSSRALSSRERHSVR